MPHDRNIPADGSQEAQPTLAETLDALGKVIERLDNREGVDRHNQGLLEHAGNLEHLLTEAVRHSANLETLWKNTEEDRQALRTHTNNLQSRLEEESQARAKLLDHTVNLERDLAEWRDEAKRTSTALANRDIELAKAREHAGNLEKRIAELEEHSARIEVEAKAQEAAAYRYKQELEAFKRVSKPGPTP